MNAFLIFALVLTAAYIIYYGFAIAQDVIMAQQKETPNSEVIDAPGDKDTKDSGIKSFDVEETPEGGFRVGTEPDPQPKEEAPVSPKPVANNPANEQPKSPSPAEQPKQKVIHETFEREKTQAEKSVDTTKKELGPIETDDDLTCIADNVYATKLENHAKEAAAAGAHNQTDNDMANGKGIDRI